MPNWLPGYGRYNARNQRRFGPRMNTPGDSGGGGATPAAPATPPATPSATPSTTPPASDTIEVDLMGERLTLPVEQARRLINARDTTKEQRRQLETQLEAHARTAADAERRARAAEEARTGDLAAAERTFSERHQSQIDKLQRAVIRQSLRAGLRSAQDFIGDDASTEDALTLLAAQDLVVDDATLEVKTRDGKPVTDVVRAFLDGRPHLRKAQPGVRRRPGEAAPADAPAKEKGKNATSMIVRGMASRLGADK